MRDIATATLSGNLTRKLELRGRCPRAPRWLGSGWPAGVAGAAVRSGGFFESCGDRLESVRAM
jgi:hypothetical protein